MGRYKPPSKPKKFKKPKKPKRPFLSKTHRQLLEKHASEIPADLTFYAFKKELLDRFRKDFVASDGNVSKYASQLKVAVQAYADSAKFALPHKEEEIDGLVENALEKIHDRSPVDEIHKICRKEGVEDSVNKHYWKYGGIFHREYKKARNSAFSNVGKFIKDHEEDIDSIVRRARGGKVFTRAAKRITSVIDLGTRIAQKKDYLDKLDKGQLMLIANNPNKLSNDALLKVFEHIDRFESQGIFLKANRLLDDQVSHLLDNGINSSLIGTRADIILARRRMAAEAKSLKKKPKAPEEPIPEEAVTPPAEPKPTPLEEKAHSLLQESSYHNLSKTIQRPLLDQIHEKLAEWHISENNVDLEQAFDEAKTALEKAITTPAKPAVKQKSKPSDYLKNGKLRSTLSFEVLWEARHGPGAGVDKLTPGSRDKLYSFIDKINSNWPEGKTVTEIPTEIMYKEGRAAFKFSFKKHKDSAYRRHYTLLLKDTMPYFPVAAGKIFQKSETSLKDSLHSSIVDAIGDRITSSRASGLTMRETIASLNAGDLTGKYAQSLFIPFHAVEEVYSPDMLLDLVNPPHGKQGIRIERIIEWTKKPKYVIETLLKLEKEGKLRDSAIENLQDLGF